MAAAIVGLAALLSGLMAVSVARIDGSRITDWDSFHDEFHRVFVFPDFYGRNIHAWIDCMTSLDCEDDGMTALHVQPGSVLTLEVLHVKRFKVQAPEQYDALVECSAFVNWRRIEQGEGPVLALAFHE